MQNLKELRRDAGLTQQKLAELAKLSRIRVCHAELGLTTLRSDEIQRVRRAIAQETKRKSARVLRELAKPVATSAA